MRIVTNITAAFREMFSGWDSVRSWYDESRGDYVVELKVSEVRIAYLRSDAYELLGKLSPGPLKLTGRWRPMVGRYRMGGGMAENRPR